jgi:MFS family permease
MLAMLTAVNMVNWADRNVVPILFPGIRRELALSDTELGMIGGLAFSAIYAISSFGFGYGADRTVRRNLILFGLIVWSVATAAGGFARGFSSLFAARFFTGIGEASLYPAAMSLIGERFPAAARGRAMGIFGAASAVGGGLGIGLGGPLSEMLGWRQVFFLYGGLGLLLVPLVMSVAERRRPRPSGADADTLGVLGELVMDRRLLLLWMSGMIMIASGIGYATWVPSYFVRFRAMDVSQAGLFFGLAMLVGGVGGAVLGGTLADRCRRSGRGSELDVSIVTAALGAPLAALTLVAQWDPLFMAAGVLAPMAIFAYFPPIQAVIIDIVPPRRHGIAYAINILFLGGVGTALGPFLIGWVSDATGSLRSAMALPVIGMVLAALLMETAKRAVVRRAPGRTEAGIASEPS